MNPAPNLPGAQPVLASARESAFYEAGFQAGKAQELQRAQAIAGAACAQLEAFAKTLISIRDRTSADVALLRQAPKKPRIIWQDLEQVVELAEMLRGSLHAAIIEHSKNAGQALQDANQAKQAFAQAVNHAQALAGKPSAVRRLLEKLLEGLP